MDFTNKVENLSPNNKWLFWHRQIAFNQAFGIESGFYIDLDDVEIVNWGKGKKQYKVKAEVMQKRLDEYTKWLESYQEKWNSDIYNGSYTDNTKKYLFGSEGFRKIAKVFGLLQI